MKKLLLIMLLATSAAQAGPYKLAAAEEIRTSGDSQPAIAPQLEELKAQIMKDEGAMALINALQDDPEIQAFLMDPAVLSAVQAGNVTVLMGNPAVLKILNNPRVRELANKLGTPLSAVP